MIDLYVYVLYDVFIYDTHYICVHELSTLLGGFTFVFMQTYIVRAIYEYVMNKPENPGKNLEFQRS